MYEGHERVQRPVGTAMVAQPSWRSLIRLEALTLALPVVAANSWF